MFIMKKKIVVNSNYYLIQYPFLELWKMKIMNNNVVGIKMGGSACET